MRSRLTTQLGRRSIQKHWKWVEPSEVEVRIQRDMEDRGTNHDSSRVAVPASHSSSTPSLGSGGINGGHHHHSLECCSRWSPTRCLGSARWPMGGGHVERDDVPKDAYHFFVWPLTLFAHDDNIGHHANNPVMTCVICSFVHSSGLSQVCKCRVTVDSAH